MLYHDILLARHVGLANTGTHRNGVPVIFFKPEQRSGSFFVVENSERKSDSCCCVHTSVLPSVAVLKLRLGIEIAINDTSACLLIY